MAYGKRISISFDSVTVDDKDINIYPDKDFYLKDAEGKKLEANAKLKEGNTYVIFIKKKN